MLKKTSETLLLKAVKTLIILALFAPLVFGPFGLSFSEYPKALYFRVVVEIALILWMVLLWLNPSYLPRTNILTLSVLLFFLVLFISSVFGFNFYRSIWGGLEIGGGLFTHFHYLTLFWALISLFKEKEDWLLLVRWVVGISFLSTLAGFIQKMGIAGFYGVSLEAGRISGTLSNPVYFGAYMVMAIFLGLYLVTVEQKKDWKIMWFIVTGLNFIALLFSGTKGALTGFLFGFGVVMVLIFFWIISPNYPKLRRLILGLTLACSLALLLAVILLAQNITFIERSGGGALGRLMAIFDPAAIEGRFMGWETAMRAWQDRPLLGWGHKSFGYLYDKYFDTHYYQHFNGYYIFFDAHNTILNLLAEAGILGAGSYILIFGLLFYALIQGRKTQGVFPTIFLISLFSGYFFQNLFAFDTVSTYVVFFFLLALVNNNYPCLKMCLKSHFKQDAKWLFKHIFKHNVLGVWNGILIIFCIFALYYGNLIPALVSYDFVKGFFSESQDFFGALNFYQKAIERNTPYQRELTFMLASRNVFLLERGLGEKEEYKRSAIQSLLQLTPYMKEHVETPDLRYLNFHETLANSYEWIYLVTKDEKALQEAKEAAKKALAFNNQWMQFYYIFGKMEVYQGNFSEAEKYFDQGFKHSRGDLTDLFNRYKFSGLSYLRIKDQHRAVQSLSKAVEAMYASMRYGAPRSPQIPDEQKRKTTQDGVSVFEMTAWLHWGLGNKETAVEIYKKALEVYPEWEIRLKANLEKMKAQG